MKILDKMDSVGAYATDRTFLKVSLTTQVLGWLVITGTRAPEIASWLPFLG